MTTTIRTATHTYRDERAADLSVSARAGLTSGLSLGTDPALAAELAYRRERLLPPAGGKNRRRRSGSTSDGRDHGWMTRWIAWLPSVPRRSSAETAKLVGCSS